jgi:hypothetical protein
MKRFNLNSAIAVIGLLIFAFLAIGRVPVDAQQGIQQVRQLGRYAVFTAHTATGATTSAVVNGTMTHNSQLIVTGAPATCTYRLQGSNDGTNWFNISAADITCTTTINSVTVDVPTRLIRGNLLTITGGTAPTVRLYYIGR